MAAEARTVRSQTQTSRKTLISRQVSPLTVENLEKIFQNLDRVLNKLGRGDLEKGFRYIVNEMLQNAEKANLKRIYFQKKGLNINDAAEYEQGMKSYCEEGQDFAREIAGRLLEFGYTVHLIVQADEHNLFLRVINNIRPVPQELEQIRTRLKLASTFHDASDAYECLHDCTADGKGLGLITSVLILRNLGARDRSYQFGVVKGQSIAQLKFPLNSVPQTDVERISQEIADEIQSLPKLPEHVATISKMLEKDTPPFSQIAASLSRDPGLTAELLRMVNSTALRRPQKVKNLTVAVSLIGVGGVKNLLDLKGAKDILDARYGDIFSLWAHARRCATLAAELAHRFEMAHLADELYVCGVLHDMGKIVLVSLHPDLMDGIAQHCSTALLSQNLAEALLLGVGHAKVGGVVASHWNFPEEFVYPIEFHHLPMLAPAPYRERAHVLHLADCVAHWSEKPGPGLVEPHTMDFFGIKNPLDLEQLAQELQTPAK